MELRILYICFCLFLVFKSAIGDADEEGAKVNAVKCYVCSSESSMECTDLEKGQTDFLQECSAGKCFVKEEHHPQILGNFVRSRGCAEETHCVNMDFPVCCECSTDGCNYNNLCSVGSGVQSTSVSKIMACIVILNFKFV